MMICGTNARCEHRKGKECLAQFFCCSQYSEAQINKLKKAIEFWKDEGEPKKAQKIQEKLDFLVA